MAMQKLLYDDEYLTDDFISKVLSDEAILSPYDSSYISQHYHTSPILGQMSSASSVNRVPVVTRTSTSFDHTPLAAPCSYFAYQFPLKNSPGDSAIPIYSAAFPETNELVLPSIDQLSISRDQVPPTMVNRYADTVNHPTMHGGWGQMDKMDDKSRLDETHDPFLCPKCDKVFTTALRYESHLRSHYEPKKRSEKGKREEPFERAVGKKKIGRDIERTEGKNPIGFERA